MVRFIKISILVFILFISCSFAQDISVLASVDSSNYLVGDFINYILEVRSGKNINLIDPFFRDSLKNLEIIKEYEPAISKNENSTITKYHYTVSYYDSAEITIPPIAVNYKVGNDTTVYISVSNPVTFNVNKIETVQQSDIKDVKEPLTIPLDIIFIIAIILIVIVVAGIASYLYRRYKKKKEGIPVEKNIIQIPAHIRALKALDNLEEEKLWQKGRIKDYHSQITGIVRAYFEERFNLPALELTTSEQMHLLERVREAEVIIITTKDFLNNADLVKFAKFVPLDSVNEEMMKQGREIIQKTIPAETTPDLIEEEAA